MISHMIMIRLFLCPALAAFAKVLAHVHVTSTHVSLAAMLFGIISAPFIVSGRLGLGSAFAAISIFSCELGDAISRQYEPSFLVKKTLGCLFERQTEIVVLMALIIYAKDTLALQAALLSMLLGCLMTMYCVVLNEARRLPLGPLSKSKRFAEKLFYLLLPSLFLLTSHSVALGYVLLFIIGAVALAMNLHAVRQFSLTMTASHGGLASVDLEPYPK